MPVNWEGGAVVRPVAAVNGFEDDLKESFAFWGCEVLKYLLITDLVSDRLDTWSKAVALPDSLNRFCGLRKSDPLICNERRV